LLYVQVLDRGLDDELALREVLQTGDDIDPVGGRLGLFAGDPTLAGKGVEAPADALGGRRGAFGGGVLQVDLMAGGGGDLGDAGAHRAGPDDGYVTPRTVARHVAILPKRETGGVGG
jgi:hypothetical protein